MSVIDEEDADNEQHPFPKLNLEIVKRTAGAERKDCAEGYWGKIRKRHHLGQETWRPRKRGPPGTPDSRSPSSFSSIRPDLALHLLLFYSRGSVTCCGNGH